MRSGLLFISNHSKKRDKVTTDVPTANPKKKIRLIKSLASIKLGVCIIVTLGTLIAWGTLVEAHYNDSVAAQKIVYGSIWMYMAMGALSISLIAVMIDRWPWQQKHMGFILAHIGILVIMTGSLITRFYGLDGSMTLQVGESSHFVSVEQMVLATYASLGDDSGFRKISENVVDFFKHRPSAEHPFEVPLAGGNVKVTQYLPYAFRDEKVVPSARPSSGSAVRFQLQNPNVSLTEWLVQPGPGREVSKNLGPATVFLSNVEPANAIGHNSLVLKPIAGSDALAYEIYLARDPKKVKKGKIKTGEQLDTGWMGIVLRVLKYLPQAEELVTFQESQQATPVSMPALKINYNGEEHWMGANSMIRLFTDQAVYILTYGNAKQDVGFDLSLKDFEVGRYPGTMRAASYASQVMVPGVGVKTISMNEPLKHAGFTFYQASFQEDDNGRPIATVLSVNRDPGRWIKYLGSLLIVFGIIHLFYFKRKSARSTAKK